MAGEPDRSSSDPSARSSSEVEHAALTAAAQRALAIDWQTPHAPFERGELDVIRTRWLDALFRSPHWHPYVWALPLGIVTATWGAAALGARLAALGAGIATWTLFEYVLHRFVFHVRVTSEPLRVVQLLVHAHHHTHPEDKRRLTATPWQIGSILVPVALTTASLGETRWPFFAGFVLGWVAYEAIHYASHHLDVRRGPLAAIKRHHLAHHHRSPRARWGISSPLWDRVFRTASTTRALND